MLNNGWLFFAYFIEMLYRSVFVGSAGVIISYFFPQYWSLG